MKAPIKLGHTPIISVDDYDQIDGLYVNNTDAKALSIGRAQYDDEQYSLKVFRHTGNRWSPQSEELPLHRCIDLSILLLRSLAPEHEVLAQSPLSERMSIGRESDIDAIVKYCRKHREHLLPRIEELRYLLETIDYKTII